MFDRPESRLFSQRNVAKTQAFFERHGTKALVMARFVPIVRTFVPVLAGVGKMDQRTFISANAIGAVLWAGVVTVLGYFLGQVDAVKNNIELAAVAVVAISLLPVGIEYLRHRRGCIATAPRHATDTVLPEPAWHRSRRTRMAHVNTAHRGVRIAAALAAVIIGVTACGTDSKSSCPLHPAPPTEVRRHRR